MKPIENITYWRDPQIRGFEICQVNGSRHVFPDHAHDGIYAIGMMESGGAYCLGAQKSYSLVSPGQVALINPSQVHSGVPVPGKRISYRMIYFEMQLMATAAAEVGRRLLDARARGAGVVLISEDLDEVLGLADRIMVIHDGQLHEAHTRDRQEIGLMMAGETLGEHA